jgi:PhzF family phenazine biosynthesis protein
MRRRFKQVDVFTARPFFGNPVAVVLDAADLSTEDMQRIARWTNLSETTFALAPTQPGADYRLRIFTPARELPFAGHPTVGSAHAVLEAGIVAAKPTLVQECAAGLLPLAIEGEGADRKIFVTAPPAISKPLPPAQADALHAALGAKWLASAVPTAITVGPTWLVVQMPDAAAVSALTPDMAKLAALGHALGLTGVTVFGRLESGSWSTPSTASHGMAGEPNRPRGGAERAAGPPVAINVRSFAPGEGVPEDPVCGSGNAAVGAYVASRPELAALGTAYRSSQGREIGRDGHVWVRLADGRVQIGGHAVTCVDGTLTTS